MASSAESAAAHALFSLPVECSGMTWNDLFERTADLEVTVEDVRDRLRERREGEDA